MQNKSNDNFLIYFGLFGIVALFALFFIEVGIDLYHGEEYLIDDQRAFCQKYGGELTDNQRFGFFYKCVRFDNDILKSCEIETINGRVGFIEDCGWDVRKGKERGE